MNKKRICSFLFAILFCVGCCCMPASAKDLGYKWNKTYVYFNCGFTTSQRNAVQAAMNKWNAVKTTTGQMMVKFSLTTGTADNDVKFVSTLPSGIVGYCDTNASGGKIFAVSIKLNSGNQWSVGKASGKYDVQTIVQHELGHALGIAHCHEASEGSGPCWSATCLSNVMYPIAKTNHRNITLTDYDISSYRLIYQNW